MLIIPMIIPIGMFIFSVKEFFKGDKSMNGYILTVLIAVIITALLAL